MLIPRYWSRASAHATTPQGKHLHLHAWRGSRSDPAEAQALAQEAVERMTARVQAGEGFPERYTYGDRPLREEVVREMAGATDDAPDAALTRNAYGALVLNAARLFFIDVDAPGADAPPSSARAEPSPSYSSPSPSRSVVWSILDRVMGRPASEAIPQPLLGIAEGILGPSSAAAPSPTASAASPSGTSSAPASSPSAAPGATAGALDRLRRWVAAHPGWRVRVYRTHSGLRYAVTHAPFSPTDGEAEEVMRALGADPQYVRLCGAQKSFRARLTPKPWRVGMENPPVRFPYESPADESAMRAWDVRYDRASAGSATCQLLEEMGTGTEHPELAELVRLHDEHTRATSGLPLA